MRVSFGFPLVFVLGCSSTSPVTPSDGGTDSSSPVDSSAGGFIPSNNVGSAPLNTTDDIVLDNANCIVATDASAASPITISCLAGNQTGKVVTQSDSSKIVVYTMKSLRVKPGAHVTFQGPTPVAFLVTDTVTIEGNVDASPTSLFMSEGRAGGAQGIDTNKDGSGAGAGKGADVLTHVGGGGAGFCGAGGGLAHAGATYGNAPIVPLLGGSSGGGGYDKSGGGGGALQIVALTSITIAAGGVVQAGGGGGKRGAGGGSGGAILLESPTVSVAGTITANGGGGAGNGVGGIGGETGHADPMAAKGGVDNNPANNGGNGAAGTQINGSDGVYAANPGSAIPDNGGGGGGGAGRIRINTASGQAQVTGVLSPDPSTSCVSQGKLTPK